MGAKPDAGPIQAALDCSELISQYDNYITASLANLQAINLTAGNTVILR